MKKFVVNLLSVLMLTFALVAVQHYIWGDLLVAEFDSDDAEIVFWAEAALEADAPLNKDYSYQGQLLPFGGQFIYVPIVKHFGFSLFALRLTLCVWSTLLILLLWLMLKAFGCSFALTSAGTASVVLMLSATQETRDIFWTHIIYYDLSVFYALGSFIFFALYLKGRRRVLWAVLFTLWTLLGSSNSSTMQGFFTLPLLGGLVLEVLFRQDLFHFKARRDLLPALLTAVCIPAGLLIFNRMTAGMPQDYTDAYTVLTPASEWLSHLTVFFARWTELFLKPFNEAIPFFSSVGIHALIRIGASFAALGFGIASLWIYPRVKTRAERVYIIFHWLLCAMMMFFFIFGNISNSCHRLTPLAFSSLVCGVILIHTLFSSAEFAPAVNLFAFASGAFTLCAALTFGVSVLRQRPDITYWNAQDSILKTICDHGLTYGYCSDFQFANALTVLTDGEVKVRYLLNDGKTLVNPKLSSMDEWYEDQPGVDRYFLAATESVVTYMPFLAENAVETYRVTQYSPEIGREKGFFLYVYERNPIPDFAEAE